MSKLVRDKIGDIMQRQGKNPEIRIASVDEYGHLLLHKLHEEVVEFTQHPCTEELADILEIILALADNLGISESQLQAVRSEKKLQKGTFSSRCVLMDTKD